ncbi:T4 family baseplate hub assembly chaperone [Streptomyces pathocidini]|uniref:T4 family baseplate hub assembly chaperone n=1 Tax=Streptomyces pathocidini TaxID=1650571 RepID=UPI0006E44D64
MGPVELLATWEAGLALHGSGRALLLHRVARPEAGTDDELLAVPVGEREADLFALRRALFGERMQVRTECGACGEAMEFDLDARELGVRTVPSEGPLRVTEGEWTVEFRLPTAADLAAVAAATDEPAADKPLALGPSALEPLAHEPSVLGSASPADDARRRLVARCTLSAVRAGKPVPAQALGELPEPVLRRLAEAAEQADPTAEVTLDVRCPDCGKATPAELDITTYLWTELDAWARDLLLDVHLLAGAYGWSEPEVLALSPLRRRYYLELCADA